MSEKTYPYKAWVLQPSFKPVEVEIVEPHGSTIFHGDISSSGKYFATGDLFASKNEAIEVGLERLQKQEADLAKRADKLEKKRKALNKASGQA